MPPVVEEACFPPGSYHRQRRSLDTQATNPSLFAWAYSPMDHREFSPPPGTADTSRSSARADRRVGDQLHNRVADSCPRLSNGG